MTRKFKTAQLKVEQGFSKFENKLKNVLSLKQQVCIDVQISSLKLCYWADALLQSSAPKPDEPCLQDVHSEIAAPQISFANCTEQAPATNGAVVSTDLGTEESQSLTNISPTFPATPHHPATTSLHSGAQNTQQEAQPPYIGKTPTSTPRYSTHSSNSGYSTPTSISNLNPSTTSSNPPTHHKSNINRKTPQHPHSIH